MYWFMKRRGPVSSTTDLFGVGGGDWHTNPPIVPCSLHDPSKAFFSISPLPPCPHSRSRVSHLRLHLLEIALQLLHIRLLRRPPDPQSFLFVRLGDDMEMDLQDLQSINLPPNTPSPSLPKILQFSFGELWRGWGKRKWSLHDQRPDGRRARCFAGDCNCRRRRRGRLIWPRARFFKFVV